MLEIVRIPVLSDNYVWLAHEPASGRTLVVDPGESDPVLAEAAARGWTITDIWNTHWHPDHTGGNAAIKAAAEAWGGCTITGPAAEADRILTLDVRVAEGDTVRIGEIEAQVIDVRAHTAGHIAFYLPTEECAFVGDTLFAMGCGRLFEGTPRDMFDALAKLGALPDATTIYCAHEYTLSNARFAAIAEPGNAAILDRLAEVEAMRAVGEATVPTTLALERATNPFLRARSVAELAERRTAKDGFSG